MTHPTPPTAPAPTPPELVHNVISEMVRHGEIPRPASLPPAPPSVSSGDVSVICRWCGYLQSGVEAGRFASHLEHTTHFASEIKELRAQVSSLQSSLRELKEQMLTPEQLRIIDNSVEGVYGQPYVELRKTIARLRSETLTPEEARECLGALGQSPVGMGFRTGPSFKMVQKLRSLSNKEADK